jgi:hypothetical protein
MSIRSTCPYNLSIYSGFFDTTIPHTLTNTMNTNTNTNTNTMNTNTNTSLPFLSSYTQGQIEFIKFLQANRVSLTVYNTDLCTDSDHKPCTVSRKNLVELLANSVYIAVPAWISTSPARRAGRGMYKIPELNADPSTLTVNNNTRGRKPGSPNRKGRISVPAVTTAPAAATKCN